MRAATSHRKPVSQHQIWQSKAEQAFDKAAEAEARGNVFMAKRYMREAVLFERHAAKEIDHAA